MSAASPPSPPKPVIALAQEDVDLVKAAVERFYGRGALIRDYSSDPNSIALHIEADREIGMEHYDMLGMLMTRIEQPISIEVTRRGARVHGNAKLAYRYGVVL